MKRTLSRRGVTLALVLMVMSLVGGLIALLAWHSGHLFQQRQIERMRLICEHVSASAADYARVHAKEWATTLPALPVELAVNDLVPAPLTGLATLSFSYSSSQRVCHLVAAVEGPTYNIQRELDIPLEQVSPVQNSQPVTQP